MTASREHAATQPASVIGALLLQRGLINQQDLDKALSFQRQFKGRLGSVLVRMGALSEDALLPVLSGQLGLTLLAADQLPTHPNEILNAIQLSGFAPEWFVNQQLVIWEGVEGVIHCASRNPIDSYLQETAAGIFLPASRQANAQIDLAVLQHGR